MPSKKSKPNTLRTSRSSAERICSEAELVGLAQEWAEECRGLAKRATGATFPRILLHGPMGAGKSTLARALIEALGVDRSSEGSPTFAIAHEYRTSEGWSVVHADGYRLRSEAELEETGLLEPLWDPIRLVIFEWMELFPETLEALRRSDPPLWEVELGFDPESPLKRKIARSVREGA